MMKVKENRFTKTIARPCLIGALLFAIVPLSFAQEGGIGTNMSANSSTGVSNAQIEALLKNVQKTGNEEGVGAANYQAQPANQKQETTSPPGSDSVGDQAFASMAHNLLPLTPEQIKTLHYLFNKTRQATAAYPGVPPKPTSTAMAVNLSPGAAPPVIRLQQGYVSSLVFIDATGAPWPIQAYDLGNNKDFNIQWNKKGNTLMVQALSAYTQGNLAVMLKGLNTPIMITLMPGQHAVDYRVDLRVPSIGPSANPVMEGLPQSESPDLMNVLNGIPPQKSQALVVKGGNAQAWLVENKVYLRTTMTLLSPGFISTMSTPDGTHAYEIEQTPVLLALSQGRTVTLTIEGL